MQVSVLKCTGERCGMIVLTVAGDGPAIQACPATHEPLKLIGKTKLSLLLENMNEMSEAEVARALL